MRSGCPRNKRKRWYRGIKASVGERTRKLKPGILRLGDLSIARISVAVDIGESLPVRVHDLEAAV